MDQLLWRLGRLSNRLWRWMVRTFHRPKVIDFGEGVDAPGDYTGTWEVYWPNGKINLRCQMTEGVEHGEYICFGRNGAVIQKGRKRNGRCRGEWMDYTEYGWHFKTTDYIDDEHFTVTHFRFDGSVIEWSRWENDVEVEVREFDPPEGGGLIIETPARGSGASGQPSRRGPA